MLRTCRTRDNTAPNVAAASAAASADIAPRVAVHPVTPSGRQDHKNADWLDRGPPGTWHNGLPDHTSVHIVSRGWALTLAHGGSRRGSSSCDLLSASLAIAPMPLAAMLPSVVSGAKTATGLDAAPTPGGFGASVTAIATLRMGSVEPAFTAFEQTVPRAQPAGGLWSPARKRMK